MKRNLLAAVIGQLLLERQLKNVEKDDKAMTAYLLTEAQHAQIVDALKEGIKWLNICDKPRECIPSHEALAMLKAMKPVEPVACIYNGNQYMRHEFMSGTIPEGSTPLYALGDTA